MSTELQKFTIWMNPNPPIQILYKRGDSGPFISRELTGSTSFQGVTSPGGFEFTQGASEFFVYGLNIAGSAYLRAQLNRLRVLQDLRPTLRNCSTIAYQIDGGGPILFGVLNTASNTVTPPGGTATTIGTGAGQAQIVTSRLGDIFFRDETSPLDSLEITGMGSRQIMPAPTAPLTAFDNDNTSRVYDRTDIRGTAGNPITYGDVDLYFFESRGVLLFQGLHEFIEGYGLRDLGEAMTIYGLDVLLVEII